MRPTHHDILLNQCNRPLVLGQIGPTSTELRQIWITRRHNSATSRLDNLNVHNRIDSQSSQYFWQWRQLTQEQHK
jgi:hypothetical protein